jgi:hypothetical protein
MNYWETKVKALERERDTLTHWAKVYDGPLGKKALDELKRRKETARDLYGKIPANHPDALTMLIEAQFNEKFHSQLIQSVEDANARKESIDKEIDAVVDVMKRNQKLRREDDVAITGDR